MKFTLSWLKDHLDTDASLDEIVETLTMIGLEVEAVDDQRRASGRSPSPRCVSAEKHPDADKLQVLMVDTGDHGEPVQVVCGAPNARAGLVGAFAAPGTYIPGIDTTLAVGTIRGVESHGMMCSERELELSDDHTGIIDLPDDAPVGTPFAAYAGLDDPVIEIGLTPNRPDATGVAGIARDLAAAGLGTVKPVRDRGAEGRLCLSRSTSGSTSPTARACARPSALRMVQGRQERAVAGLDAAAAEAIGLRPINALVDITNYVTFDRGRPLHVFDADKVKGDLTVRRAQGGREHCWRSTSELHARPVDVRHRRRQRAGIACRHHGRRGFGLRRKRPSTS